MKNLLDRIRLLFRKDRESYYLLYPLLGFLPRNIRHYKMALTHSSCATGSKRKLSCNERLEFLGDAVLGSVASDYLYARFGKEREGFLSKARSRLVCRESLNDIAVRMGLDKFVIADELTHQHNSYIYGNAFEALVGAIYIDRGYGYCRNFLFDRVFDALADIELLLVSDKNFKSRLIEWSQKRHRQVSFVLCSEEIRPDGPYFVSDVLVDGVIMGHGEGFSKRESQQRAAQEALQQIKSEATK